MSRGSGHGQVGVAVRFGHGVGVVGEECACGPLGGVDGEEFGGAQRRERHRPRPRRSHLRGAFELNDGQLANQSDVTVRGGSSQSPDAAPPAVLQGGLVVPTASAVHPVAAGAGVGLRIVQEPHGNAGKAVAAVRSGSGSRVATTRTRAMSSVQ